MELYLAIIQTIMAFAACSAVLVAWYGLSTWRLQSEAAIGRRVLVATYKLRNVIQDVRFELKLVCEMGSTALEAERARLVRRVMGAVAELDAVALEADAAWDRLSVRPLRY